MVDLGVGNKKDRFFYLLFSLLVVSIPSIFLGGCGNQNKEAQKEITSIQIVDRNGFKETISSPDRLAIYKKTDFLTPQPYDKVLRMFARNEHGKTSAKLTAYHKNGQPWKYLEVVNGRAYGIYREWYSNGVLRLDIKVVEGLGDLSEEAQLGWIFDGISHAWDEKGNLLAVIHYEKGKLQGNAQYYHLNGEIRKCVPYENDLIEGDLLYYDEKGKVIGQTVYKEGKREGIATYQGDRFQPRYFEKYSQDCLIQASYHDFSGKIIETIEDGIGRQPIYINGFLDSIRDYRNGIPEGKVQCFNPDGSLKSLFHLKNGMKHGEEWIYYMRTKEDEIEPEPKLYIEWYEDTIHGMCRSWYRNGILESEREMINNRKQGVSSAWYKDGSFMLIEEYENDRLQQGMYMKKGESRPVSSVENGVGTATLFDGDGYFLKRILYQKGEVVDEL